jgi:tetratricopeptide (TPR) repeat protein
VIDVSKKTEMVIMVYDYENNGLQGVSVYIDEELIGKTDVNGRYLLSLKEGNEYSIRIQKNGYERFDRSFVYDPFYVLYFQTGNAFQLLRLAEKAMDEGSYDEAVDLSDKSIDLDEQRIDALFLKAAAEYRRGRIKEAFVIVDGMISSGKDNDFLREFYEMLSDLEGEI